MFLLLLSPASLPLPPSLPPSSLSFLGRHSLLSLTLSSLVPLVGAVITNPPADLTVFVGETANFTCVATAEPAHRVEWQFGNEIINSTGRYNVTDVDEMTSLLVIRSVEGGDAGEYLCLVKNLHGVDQESAVLTVVCESAGSWVVCEHVCVCVCVCMNNHIYSTLFKIQERKSDRRSREIEQRKESQNTHT